jgi:hypothetical protein
MGVDKFSRRRHMFENEGGGQIFSGRKPTYATCNIIVGHYFKAVA